MINAAAAIVPTIPGQPGKGALPVGGELFALSMSTLPEMAGVSGDAPANTIPLAADDPVRQALAAPGMPLPTVDAAAIDPALAWLPAVNIAVPAPMEIPPALANAGTDARPDRPFVFTGTPVLNGSTSVGALAMGSTTRPAPAVAVAPPLPDTPAVRPLAPGRAAMPDAPAGDATPQAIPPEPIAEPLAATPGTSPAAAKPTDTPQAATTTNTPQAATLPQTSQAATGDTSGRPSSDMPVAEPLARVPASSPAPRKRAASADIDAATAGDPAKPLRRKGSPATETLAATPAASEAPALQVVHATLPAIAPEPDAPATVSDDIVPDEVVTRRGAAPENRHHTIRASSGPAIDEPVEAADEEATELAAPLPAGRADQTITSAPLPTPPAMAPVAQAPTIPVQPVVQTVVQDVAVVPKGAAPVSSRLPARENRSRPDDASTLPGTTPVPTSVASNGDSAALAPPPSQRPEMPAPARSPADMQVGDRVPASAVVPEPAQAKLDAVDTRREIPAAASARRSPAAAPPMTILQPAAVTPVAIPVSEDEATDPQRPESLARERSAPRVPGPAIPSAAPLPLPADPGGIDPAGRAPDPVARPVRATTRDPAVASAVPLPTTATTMATATGMETGAPAPDRAEPTPRTVAAMPVDQVANAATDPAGSTTPAPAGVATPPGPERAKPDSPTPAAQPAIIADPAPLIDVARPSAGQQAPDDRVPASPAPSDPSPVTVDARSTTVSPVRDSGAAPMADTAGPSRSVDAAPSTPAATSVPTPVIAVAAPVAVAAVSPASDVAPEAVPAGTMPAPTPAAAPTPRPTFMREVSGTPRQTVALRPRTAAPSQPTAGTTAPAAEVFGAAKHAATGADERKRVAPLNPAAATVAPVATAAPTHGASPVVDTTRPTLDMRQDSWPTHMIDRIEALRDAANANDTRIRLVPDALGAIDISVRMVGDAIHVRFAADNGTTRALIEDAQPRLAEVAQERGLRIGQTIVEPAPATQSGAGQSSSQPQSQPGGQSPAGSAQQQTATQGQGQAQPQAGQQQPRQQQHTAPARQPAPARSPSTDTDAGTNGRIA